MSTTVTYKGQTLTTVNNQTKTLETAGTFLEDDITLADVTAAGATNVVEGTFTTGSTSGANSLTLPYTGNGYPIMAMVWVDGGLYEHDTTWYTTIHRYAVGLWDFCKRDSDTPTYTGSGNNNAGAVRCMYKSSTSSATSISSTTSNSANTLTNLSASASSNACVRFLGATRMSYFVAGTSYGLMPSVRYRYIVYYSE